MNFDPSLIFSSPLDYVMSLFLSNIVVLPIAICLLMAPVMILLRNTAKAQKYIAIGVSAFLLLTGIVLFLNVYKNGILVYDIGEFGKYGIVLVGDLLSALLVLLNTFLGFLVLIYSLDYIERKSLSDSYFVLFFLMLGGINGIFLTGDLFNMFVFFEIMFLSSTGLIMANESLGVTDSSHKLEATYKYLVLGMLGSFLMLIAITTIYASIGSLNIADLAAKIQILTDAGTVPWVVIAAALLFVVVFGNKAALVPLHFWLPDVHPTAPTPISAMLSGVLIKVGIYGILRILFVVLAPALSFVLPIVMFFALITIAVGAFSAIGQSDLKRVLAYSSVSQIGYILLGLSFGTVGAIAAALMYLVNHAVAKSLLFLTAGGIIHETETRDLRKMGGLITILPLFSMAFLIGAMSIAGIPPTGGFIAKFALFQSAVLGQFYLPFLIALVCAIATIFYMFRTWISIFWGENRGNDSFLKTEADVSSNEHLTESHSDSPAGPHTDSHTDSSAGPHTDSHTDSPAGPHVDLHNVHSAPALPEPEHKKHKISFEIAIPIVVLCAVVFLLGIYPEPLYMVSNLIAGQILDPSAYISTVLERGPR
ncbi:proton-conducting transporter membrane subunit [Methanolapillus ohkumae]|uniref:NAD(P)H-quinone oxidoreductase subunit 2, chloroplastic n=1 Tax=Methanolapillus ohkumae TaxID=3028298 RepID=A0AA96V8E3_9EURY|nr:NAD(P)H-quinone oxidoreductase subunit 2, chloroplastic [Methanosarcinaceae archaeon Am2]